jgi:hypothetical protein
LWPWSGTANPWRNLRSFSTHRPADLILRPGTRPRMSRWYWSPPHGGGVKRILITHVSRNRCAARGTFRQMAEAGALMECTARAPGGVAARSMSAARREGRRARSRRSGAHFVIAPTLDSAATDSSGGMRSFHGGVAGGRHSADPST